MWLLTNESIFSTFIESGHGIVIRNVILFNFHDILSVDDKIQLLSKK